MNVKRLICYECSVEILTQEIDFIKRHLKRSFKLKRKLNRTAKGKRAKGLLVKSKMLDKITAEDDVNKNIYKGHIISIRGTN